MGPAYLPTYLRTYVPTYLSHCKLSRALELWNLPIDADKMRDLVASCDVDGDGQISYQVLTYLLTKRRPDLLPGTYALTY